MSVNYYPIKCKSFLHYIGEKGPPFNWTASPYRGCEHSCPYCFARYTHEYLGYNPGVDFDTKIFIKVNAADVLENELSSPKWRKEFVLLGSVCDPYQPVEKKFKITRQVLEVFAKHKNPVFIATKSNLILRDIDLLYEMAKHKIIGVSITITTLDENIRSKMEPRAPSTEDRIYVVKKLSDAGIKVDILFMPIFPYLTDDFENINGVVEAAKDAGAEHIVPGILYLRSSCRNRFISLIKKEFPELLPKYIALYKRACAPKEYISKIHSTFKKAQRRYGFKKIDVQKFKEKHTKLKC